jgi:hypothetical protein
MRLFKPLLIFIAIIISFFVFKSEIERMYHNFQEYLVHRKSIIWNKERKLKVSDFKFEPNESFIDNFSARVGITFVHQLKNDIYFSSTTVFLPYDSYVTDTINKNFLRIAQVRFDMCEIYRRRLELKIDKLRKLNINTISSDTIVKYGELYYDFFEKEWTNFNKLSEEEHVKKLEEMEEIIRIELEKDV